MLNKRKEVVGAVVSRLKPAEENLDLALASLAGLNASLPAARAQSGLALSVGHEALAAFSEAQSLLVRARGKVIEGHRLLEETRRAFRFPEVANGGLGDKDPNSVFPVPTGGHLTVVSG
ncbi:hypothetical protein ACFSCW_14335 [Sphingomonas tabacisoli]|uniref:Uncharacterized protein n=1 Tax=Sphingomonas tabacisoli TaxID=2249466 RepID=A0ABW4I734_9SPHN